MNVRRAEKLFAIRQNSNLTFEDKRAMMMTE